MVDRIPVPSANSVRDPVSLSDSGLSVDHRARLALRDDAAYEDLVRSQGPRMHALARRYLGNRSDADDAVQDAFVALFRGIEAFDGRSSVETWLHRIVVNRAIDLLRRRTRRLEVPISAPEHAAAAERPARTRSAESVAEMADTYRVVVDAVDRLPVTQRVVIRLSDIEGLGLDATATALGVNASTVRVRLHRARRTLRSHLIRHATP